MPALRYLHGSSLPRSERLQSGDSKLSPKQTNKRRSCFGLLGPVYAADFLRAGFGCRGVLRPASGIVKKKAEGAHFPAHNRACLGKRATTSTGAKTCGALKVGVAERASVRSMSALSRNRFVWGLRITSGRCLAFTWGAAIARLHRDLTPQRAFAGAGQRPKCSETRMRSLV